MKIEINAQSAFVYLGKADAQAQISSNKPSIIFIHGAQQDHSCWALQSRWFAHHGYNTFAPDLPGHGLSEGSPLQTVEELANWTHQLLDLFNISQAYIVGHSMGSLVALDVACAFPDRIKKIAIIGTSRPMPVSDVLLDAAQNNEAKAISMVNNFSHSTRAQIGRNTVPGMWMLGVNQRLMERQIKGVFYIDLSACNNYSVNQERLSALCVPTLIIAGAQDRMTSATAALKLAEQIKGVRLEIIPGVGHALMAEAPDVVLDLLREFLN